MYSTCVSFALFFLTWTTVVYGDGIQKGQQLPDTSKIDGQLTVNLNVDQFFSLWIVFNNDNVKISDAPFTILAPQNSASKHADNLLQKPDLVKKLLLDHVVLGSRLDLTNASNISFTTLSGKKVHIKQINGTGKLKANEANILDHKQVLPNGLLVVLDNYMFPGEETVKKRNVTQAKVVELQPTTSPVVTVKTLKEESKNQSNGTFVENVMEILSFLKSGVRVFQHFLTRSNVSKLLNNVDEYTVFVPTDHAFQRWHPIDWGFYPFSVPEFTESIIVNHFVKGRLKQDTIKDGQVIKSLGGRDIVFKKSPTLTVNNAVVVKGDTPVTKGNIMFIGEVLFVSESVVSRLHQQHKDKETPPLLAFPWFGAQFLSHAFLALERDKMFSQITRFLNLADLAPYVSGTGYTFFVPTDKAFEALGLDRMPDNYLSTDDGLQMLLNHFVKGRLYAKDLQDNSELTTLGNKTINIRRKENIVTVNDAKIVESEVFVYNLGTMFYIDKILFATANSLPGATTRKYNKSTTSTTEITTVPDVETVPSELSYKGGSEPDVLFSESADLTSDSTYNTDTTENIDFTTDFINVTEIVTVNTKNVSIIK